MPRPACRLPRANDGSSPECAGTAQIAHRKYSRLVRIRARTGSRFAPRFATAKARTWPPACYQKLWLPVAGFHCGFQGFAVVSAGNLIIRKTSYQVLKLWKMGHATKPKARLPLIA